MKKVLFGLILAVLFVPFLMGETLTTRTVGYVIIDTVATTDGNDTAFTTTDFAFVSHKADCDFDLRTGSKESDSTAINAIELLFDTTDSDGGTATVDIYCAATTGPWEKICSLALTTGTAISASGRLWYDTAVATNVHLTIVKVGDSGNNHAAKVSFDTCGYRWIKILVTARTSGKGVRTFARWY